MSKVSNVLRRSASNVVNGVFGTAHLVLDTTLAGITYTEGYLIEKIDFVPREYVMLQRAQSTLDSQDRAHAKVILMHSKAIGFRDSVHARFKHKAEKRYKRGKGKPSTQACENVVLYV